MNFNKNDIEFYLLTKEYDSLSKEELAIVSEAVESKEEYLSLKQLLLVMEEAPADVELTPNPEIKGELITAFEKARWGTEVEMATEAKIVPLTEENNQKKRSFFWISIAASLTLLIGLFLNRETLFLPESNQLALVATEEVKEAEQPKNIIEKVETITEKLDTVIINEVDDLVLENEEIEPKIVNSKMLNVTSDDDTKRLTQNNSSTFAWSTAVEEETADDFSGDEVIMELANVADNEIVNKDKLVAGSMESAAAVNAEESISFSDVKLSSETEKDLSLVNESISLKDDKDLIDLLYTAL